MEVTTLLDVFVSTPPPVSLVAFQYWCSGYTIAQVAEAQLPHLIAALAERKPATSPAKDAADAAAGATRPVATQPTPYDWMRQLEREDLRALLLNDAEDQYRTFASLLHYLQSPRSLLTQCFLPLAPSVMHQLLDKYYAFDNAVLRDLLGKRLNRRMRRDLDEVCDRTGVLLPSAQRQFDNLQSVYKAVSDLDGMLVVNISDLFCISTELASCYACFIFLSVHQIETSKRRASALTCSDLIFCADQMMSAFSDGQSGPELDQVFLDDLRDLKSLVFNDSSVQSEMTSVVARLLEKQIGTVDAARIGKVITPLFKDILALAAGLGGRDLRDFLVDCTDRVLDRLRRLGIKTPMLETLLGHMVTGFNALQRLSYQRRDRFQRAWARFVDGLKPILLRLWTHLPIEYSA